MADSKTPQVSVVIPNWNGLKFLKVVLPSLKAQTFTDFETIVVDNGSDDGSREYLAKDWPKVKVIALPENRGFAGPMNDGIAAALGELVALLNNDLELDPKWMEVMVTASKQRRDSAMFGGKLLHYDQHNVIDGTGEILTWYTTFLKRGHGETDTGQYEAAGYCFGPNAAAALYRRELFEKVGAFDADFFAYLEDSDLHLRAQLAGLTAWYEPRAIAYHMGGLTSARRSKQFLYYWHRNRVWLILKDFPFGLMVKHSPRLAFAFAKTAFGGLKRGELGILLRAWLAAWAALPRTLGKRRRIQRTRTVSSAYLESVVSKSFGEPSRLLNRIGRKP